MKLCVDCKHYRGIPKDIAAAYLAKGLTPTPALCNAFPKGNPDPIYGCYQDYHTCDVGRRRGASCGPEAKLYHANT